MNFFTGYIGTYTAVSGGMGKGIYSFRMDPASGDIKDICLAAQTDNPSWLCLSGRYLYAANEIDNFQGGGTGAVSAYGIREDGSLEFINRKSSGGIWPCHLARYAKPDNRVVRQLTSNRRFALPDKSHALLLAANYGDGTVAVLRLENSGGIGDMCQFIRLDGSGPNPSRQEGPHAHAVMFDSRGDFVFVYDLGSDSIMTYRYDPLAAEPLQALPSPRYKSARGSGPRHGVFSIRENCLYNLHELDSTLDVLRFDSRTGRLEKIQSVSTLPADSAGKIENFPAEVSVSPGGELVCVSNRGHDSIAVYKVRGEGKLNFINTFAAGGKWPRHFAFDPSGRFLLAANQKSGTLTVFSVDTITGVLKQTGEFPVPSPACVVIGTY